VRDGGESWASPPQSSIATLGRVRGRDHRSRRLSSHPSRDPAIAAVLSNSSGARPPVAALLPPGPRRRRQSIRADGGRVVAEEVPRAAHRVIRISRLPDSRTLIEGWVLGIGLSVGAKTVAAAPSDSAPPGAAAAESAGDAVHKAPTGVAAARGVAARAATIWAAGSADGTAAVGVAGAARVAAIRVGSELDGGLGARFAKITRDRGPRSPVRSGDASRGHAAGCAAASKQAEYARQCDALFHLRIPPVFDRR
jgi:hypothetical protein